MEKFLLNDIPTLWLGVAMVVLTVLATLIGLTIVRRSVELRRLREQHDVAGFLIAVVGVLYAVLLAFMVVIQWEQFSGAENNASTEAASIGGLYRDGIALGPSGHELTTAVATYAADVLNREWPYMAKHQEEEPHSDHLRNAVWKAVRDLQPKDATGVDFVRQAINDVAAATAARRQRVEDSSSELPTTLWVVLLVGGVLTIGFTYFFGLESLRSQGAMLSTLAVTIALSLFVILSLDLPFTGDVAIQPTALQDEVKEFCSYNFIHPQLGSNCEVVPAATLAEKTSRAADPRPAAG